MHEAVVGGLYFVLSVEYNGCGVGVVVGVIVLCLAGVQVVADGEHEVSFSVVVEDGGKYDSVPSVSRWQGTCIDKLQRIGVDKAGVVGKRCGGGVAEV